MEGNLEENGAGTVQEAEEERAKSLISKVVGAGSREKLVNIRKIAQFCNRRGTKGRRKGWKPGSKRYRKWEI